jgi:TetR/AcrR family transcriptional regulator, transcriptional repressor for nem operon
MPIIRPSLANVRLTGHLFFRRQTGTRDHLLSTGLRVLHARGFHASGVQDITDAAQVPKDSFYTHFDSKEQFGADVLGRYWESQAGVATSILSDETRSPLQRLKAYFGSKTRARSPAALETGL